MELNASNWGKVVGIACLCEPENKACKDWYMDKQEIRNKIAEFKAAKKAVKGTPCEVYSRVVGYLRPVQNWNKGKKEEFALRKNMKIT